MWRCRLQMDRCGGPWVVTIRGQYTVLTACTTSVSFASSVVCVVLRSIATHDVYFVPPHPVDKVRVVTPWDYSVVVRPWAYVSLLRGTQWVPPSTRSLHLKFYLLETRGSSFPGLPTCRPVCLLSPSSTLHRLVVHCPLERLCELKIRITISFGVPGDHSYGLFLWMSMSCRRVVSMTLSVFIALFMTGFLERDAEEVRISTAKVSTFIKKFPS